MKNVSMRWRNRLALWVTILGCSAMVGDLMGCLLLKGLGAAWCFAPFPKVFCENQGLEGFASEFTLLAKRQDGSVVKIPLTAEMYARLKGPYNRRNVYGAVLSFAPKLPKELWVSVYNYGLGADGVLPGEFGLPEEFKELAVQVHTRTSGRTDAWVLREQ